MWIRVDDKLANHPKILRAGAALGRNGAAIALGMFHWGLSYTNEYLTDGFLSEAVVSACRHVAKPLAVAEVLVGARLWEVAQGGFRIHDFHDWNMSAEEAREFRRRKAESGRLGGRISGQKRAKQSAKHDESTCLEGASAFGEANAEADAKQPASSRARDPDPDPDPDPEELERTGGALRPDSRNGNGQGGLFRVIERLAFAVIAEEAPDTNDEGEFAEALKRACARVQIDYAADPEVIPKVVRSVTYKLQRAIA